MEFRNSKSLETGWLTVEQRKKEQWNIILGETAFCECLLLLLFQILIIHRWNGRAYEFSSMRSLELGLEVLIQNIPSPETKKETFDTEFARFYCTTRAVHWRNSKILNCHRKTQPSRGILSVPSKHSQAPWIFDYSLTHKVAFSIQISARFHFSGITIYTFQLFPSPPPQRSPSRNKNFKFASIPASRASAKEK